MRDMTYRAIGGVLLAAGVGCGGHVEDQTEGACSGSRPPEFRVTGLLTVTVGDALAEKPRTMLLPSTRVFLLPLVQCDRVRKSSFDELRGNGLRPVASTYSASDGTFLLLVPPGSYSIFTDFEGRLQPVLSVSGQCNRVDVDDSDVALPIGRGGVCNVDLSAK